MLQWLYAELGFFGSILLSLFLFVAFIFWFSGLAGIAGLQDSNRTKNTKILVAVIFPPFSIGWLLYDIYRQHRVMKSSKSSI
jgi:hypothetical protein